MADLLDRYGAGGQTRQRDQPRPSSGLTLDPITVTDEPAAEPPGGGDLLSRYGADQQQNQRPTDPTTPWKPTGVQRFTENVREGWRNNLIGDELARRRVGLHDQELAGSAAEALSLMSELGTDTVPSRNEIQRIARERDDMVLGDVFPLIERYAGQTADELRGFKDERTARADERRQENLPGEMEARQRYQAMQGFAEEGGILGTTGRGLTSLAGQLVGAGASPENLVPVSRGPTALNTFGRGAGVNALISGAIDPTIQRTEQDLGLRDEYSLTDTGINAAIGGLLGGTFNLTPEIASAIRNRVMANRGERIDPEADFSDPTGAPREVTASQREILDAVGRDVLEAAQRDGLPLDEAIARSTGADAPEPMPRRTEDERAAARQREGELADVFAQPEVTRRGNIDEIGEPIVPPEGSRAPRPDAVRDDTGSVVSTDELAARRAVQNAMRDTDTELTPGRLRAATDEVLRGADPTETVRSYSPQTAEDAFTQSRWRRFQRDEEVADGRQSARDFQPGGRPRDEGAALTMLDAQRGPDGRLSGGTPVERTNQLVQGPDGEALQIVRVNGQETAVPVDRLSEVPRSDNPRMEQDFQARAPRRRPGVGEDTDPVPRRSTDDISGRQAARTRQPDDFDFQPAPRGGDQPEPQGPFDPDFGPTAERAAPPTPRGLPRTASEGRQPPQARPEPPVREQPQARPARQTEQPASRPDFRADRELTPDELRDNPNFTLIDDDPSNTRFAPNRPYSERINDPDVTAQLDRMARDAGWEQVGGRMTKRGEDPNKPDTNVEIGRTPWIARDPELMDVVKGTGYNTPQKLRRLVEKAKSGQRLTPKQQGIMDELALQADARQFDIRQGEAARRAANDDLGEPRDIDDIPWPDETNRRPGSERDFDLDSQTESSLRADADSRRQSDRQRAQADSRADADRQRDDFDLTGSDRPADANPRQADVVEEARAASRADDDVPESMRDPAGMADRAGVETYRVGAGTLYSGIPLNVITDAIRRVFRTAFTGDDAAMRAYSTRMRDMIGDLRAVRDRTQNLPIGSIMRSTWEMTLGSVDGRFRGLAARYDSKILTSLADAFHQTAGGRNAQGRDQQTLSARRDSTLNKFGKPFKRIADTMAENGIGRRDRAALQRIRKMIENPRAPRKGAEGKVAQDVEKFMRDMLQYQRDRGVDIGQVEGYFPRWLDRGLVAKNRNAFVNKATRAYQKMNMSEPEARRSAAALADAVMHAGDSNLRADTPGGAGSVGDATKPRKLSRAAADELDAFWQADIEGAMANYMQAAVKRAEIADTTVRVGDQDMKLGEGFENWPEIETALRREMEAKGMDGEVVNNDLKTIRDHVLASTGMHLSNASAAGMTASAWLRAMGGVSLMDRVAIASFPELMTGALRATSGNQARDMATNLRNLRFHLEGVTGGIVRRMTGGKLGRQQALEEAYDLAEHLGAIAGDAFSYSMQARLMGDEPTSRALAGLQDKFYKNVGLTQLNDYTRVTSLRHANHFMRSLSRDVLRDGRNANRARFNLRDLGVKRGQEKEFADFFARNFGDDMPTAARLQQLTEAGGKDGRMAGAYGRAIQTFVDQSVMRPDTSTRPRWASNPAGAVAFHLLGFTWAFQRNVVNRIGRIATDKQDLSVIDRAQMLGGFVPAAASMYGIAMLGGKLRDALNESASTNDPTPRTDGFERERAFTYSGFSGKMDPFLQLFGGLRYQRSPAETLAGPSLGGVLSASEAFLNQSLNSSDNTNTAERRAMREFHRVLVTPALQAGLTMVPGGGFVTNAVRSGTAITGVRSTREPFVDAIAGEEDPSVTKRRTKNPTEGFIEGQINRRRESNDPIPAGRASSRQSSRGGTRESSRESSR